MKPSRLSIFISVCLLLVAFQNCSRVSFSSLLSIDFASKSNGGSYGGKLVGNFYRYLPEFTCEGNPAPKSTIEATLSSIQWTENTTQACGSTVRELDPATIDRSVFQSELIGYQEGIYKGFEAPPASIPTSLVEVWCRDRTDAQGVETITYYDSQSKSSVSRIYSQAQSIPDFAVTRSIDGETVYSSLAQGFELRVFRDQPAPQQGLVKGHLTAMIDGRQVQQETFCRLGSALDPQWLPTFAVADVSFMINAKSNFSTGNWVDLNWSAPAGTNAYGYTASYRTGASKPVSCTDGTIVPASDITSTGLKLNSIITDVELNVRVCALNPQAQAVEKKAVELNIFPGQGYSFLPVLYTEPWPSSNFGVPFANVSAFVGDVNEDGYVDLAILGSGSGNYLVVSGKDAARLMTLNFSSAEIVRQGDADGDGKEDFVLATPAMNNVKIVSASSGQLLRNFNGPSDALGFGTSAISLGDLNGDSRADYLITANSVTGGPGRLYALSGADGSPLWIRDSKTSGNRFKVYRGGDFDGDGQADFVLMDGMNVAVYNSKNVLIKDLGNVFDKSNDPLAEVFALGDTNGDRLSEIALRGPVNGKTWVQIKSMKELKFQISSFEIPVQMTEATSIIINMGDINHDGISDYFIDGSTTEMQLAVVDGKSGRILKMLTNQIGIMFNRETADFNKDGIPDLLFRNQVMSMEKLIH